ncbi:hypothetical protein [Streptomyces bohaiensis]|uniref:hypothetical protein n=1 Tax=Streptomyces bohaiensis TaxID=1431344 RepID=UPI003B7CC081
MTERDKERGDGRDPLDEEAAWAQIVAGYGDTPPTPGETAEAAGSPDQGRGDGTGDGIVPGVWHPDAVPDHGTGPTRGGAERPDPAEDPAATNDGPEAPDGGPERPPFPDGEGGAADRPAGEDGTALPGEVNRLDAHGQWEGPGPRDWAPEEEEGEGRFVPPEPPPLPETDMITRFAWLGVIGGPVLLVGCAILGVELTWWLTTAGVGGFLGGMATLVLGMRDDPDDEWTDPGSGAVV